MPQTDGYGQNIASPTLTDPPNIQTAFNGVVDGLTQRSVMRFPSATVRGGTLSTPQAGMLTYLTDVQQLQVFDGDTWKPVVAGSYLPRVNIQLASGWAPWEGNSIAPSVRQSGDIVYLEGRLKRSNDGNIGAQNGVQIATLPAAYCPVGHYAEGFVTLTGTPLGQGAPIGRIEIWPDDGTANARRILFWSDKTTSLVGFSSWWFVN